MRGSLLGMMRVSIALCLLASIGALAGKWSILSQTERRAADLSAQIAPLVERIQVVPEIVTGLHDALQQVRKSTSVEQLEQLEQGLRALLARGALHRTEQSRQLPQLFARLITLQRQIVLERAAVNAVFAAEARRLEDLSVALTAELSRAVLSLADAEPSAGSARSTGCRGPPSPGSSPSRRRAWPWSPRNRTARSP